VARPGHKNIFTYILPNFLHMNSFWQKIADGIAAINEWVGRGVSWLTFLLVVLVCFDVVFRYLFNDTEAWIMELEWHMFALIFLLGAGFAFKHDRHVRVDLFYSRFSEKDKALLNMIGGLLFLIPWCTMIIWASFQYANVSFQIREVSPDPGGLPARYIIKYAITVGGVLLLLQAISNTIESYLTYRSAGKTEA
jgi:TRAP-type mannitol/chloroaromatic compound transport system permease small subunit